MPVREYIKPKNKHPVYTRWTDPFTFMSRDYLLGLGSGDVNAGYQLVLDGYIKSWNAAAMTKTYEEMPLIDKEHGMEWIPIHRDGKELRGFINDKGETVPEGEL